MLTSVFMPLLRMQISRTGDHRGGLMMTLSLSDSRGVSRCWSLLSIVVLSPAVMVNMVIPGQTADNGAQTQRHRRQVWREVLDLGQG